MKIKCSAKTLIKVYNEDRPGPGWNGMFYRWLEIKYGITLYDSKDADAYYTLEGNEKDVTMFLLKWL